MTSHLPQRGVITLHLVATTLSTHYGLNHATSAHQNRMLRADSPSAWRYWKFCY